MTEDSRTSPSEAGLPSWRPGPLAGLRVLSIENFLSANHATYLMGMLGADVIKVETPRTGDGLRGLGPYFVDDKGHRRAPGELRVMADKRSIGLDLRSEAGRKIFFDLVAKVDVVYTNQKPSSMRTSLNITYEMLKERNPEVIYTTLSGFGYDDLVPSGPYGDFPAFDIIAQGMAGIQFRAEGDGDRPGYNGLAIGDEVTSMLTVIGTLAAVVARDATHEPQRVDVAMHDAMVFLNQLTLGTYLMLGNLPRRGRSGTSAPYGSFRTRDGWVNIGVGSDAIWRRFCVAAGQPELATSDQYGTSVGRTSHVVELDALVEAWTSTLDTADVVERLRVANVPCAPVLTVPQVVDSPQVAARDMIATIDDPVAGPQRVAGNPIKMSSIRRTELLPPPLLGEHTAEVLRELLGMPEDAIAKLEAEGVLDASAGRSWLGDAPA